MLLKRVVTFLLTAIILFADSGQTIYAHTCLKTKHTHISIGEPKHCCLEKKETSKCTVKKSSCCEVNSKYLKQNFIIQQTEVKQITAVVAILSLAQIFQLLPNIISNERATNTSPPFALCKSAITFTQAFRI